MTVAVDTAPARDEDFALTGMGQPLLQDGRTQGALVPKLGDPTMMADLFEQMGFRSAHQGRSGRRAAFSRRGQDLRKWRPPSVLKIAARGSEVRPWNLETGDRPRWHHASGFQNSRLRVPKASFRRAERLRVMAGRGAAGNRGKGASRDHSAFVARAASTVQKAVRPRISIWKYRSTPSEPVLGGDIGSAQPDASTFERENLGTRGVRPSPGRQRLPKRKQGSGT